MSFTEDELYMRTETDLSKVKAAAEMLLMTDIHETPYSPMVVQHPFTSSGIVGVKDSGEEDPGHHRESGKPAAVANANAKNDR